jgi:hypothetical protein
MRSLLVLAAFPAADWRARMSSRVSGASFQQVQSYLCQKKLDLVHMM